MASLYACKSHKNKPFINLINYIMKTQFKQEWNDNEFKQVKKAVLKHFKGLVITQAGEHAQPIKSVITNYTDLDNLLGLAYTSTSIYAILGICNKVYKYELFCISLDGTIYAECWDKKEKNIYIKIGSVN